MAPEMLAGRVGTADRGPLALMLDAALHEAAHAPEQVGWRGLRTRAMATHMMVHPRAPPPPALPRPLAAPRAPRTGLIGTFALALALPSPQHGRVTSAEMLVNLAPPRRSCAALTRHS